VTFLACYNVFYIIFKTIEKKLSYILTVNHWNRKHILTMNFDSNKTILGNVGSHSPYSLN